MLCTLITVMMSSGLMALLLASMLVGVTMLTIHSATPLRLVTLTVCIVQSPSGTM